MSNNVFTGFVIKKNSKSGTKNGRDWTAWSVKLEDKDGNEISKWFRFGFKEPQLKEGDYVRFACSEVQEKFATVEADTLQISKNPPKRAEKQQSSGRSSGGSSSGGGYNSPEQRADRAYHSARGSAIEAVDVLLKHDALPISKAKSKAGEAKRYEEVMEFIDKITVKYFRDEFAEYSGDFRVLERVADEGVSQPPKTGDLPADADETPDENGFEDEGDSDDTADFPEDDEGF